MVQGPRDDTPTPLSDQADVEKEGDVWAALWREDQPYDCFLDPLGSPALEPLVPWAIRESAKSFPVSTGVGADNTSPRAVARLSDALIKALCAILMACELWGAWPALVRYVLIVLLPKSEGGRRPIGLFPTVVRVWSRARVIVARAWESAHSRPTIFGGAGMGAQRAAWVSAFKAEAAARKDATFTQSLLDLVKAFEQIPHRILARYAVKHGYNLWLLRLSLAAYRLQRSIGAEGTYSRTILAVCGITAGSSFATTELRVILLDVVDDTCAIWKSLSFSLYVDDAALAADGADDVAVAVTAGATDHAIRLMEDGLGLEVSVTKSVATASTFGVAVRTARCSVTSKLTPKRTAKLLGAAAGGGRRRRARYSAARLRTFKTKLKRIKALRRLGVDATTIVRATGAPALAYGWEVTGVSDSQLKAARCAVATAAAPDAGGKNPDVVLAVLDARGGTVDPAFMAHIGPIKSWALAWWQGWAPPARARAGVL